MAESTIATGSTPAPKNVFARFIGIIFAPKDTFNDVVTRPRVLGMLALICVLSAVLLVGFFSTPVGRNAFVEMMIANAGDNVTDQQVQAFEKMGSFAPVFGAASLIGIPFYLLVISGLVFAIFNAALGGSATFKQVFAVVTHSWVPLAASQFFTLPLSYVRGSLSSATNLGVLLPMIEEDSFLGHFLGTIDFFWVWACIVLSIGLAVLYRRKTQPILTGFLVLYGVIALIIAFVKS